MDIEQSFVSKVRVRKVKYTAQRKQILVTWYISPLREGLFKRWAKIPFSIIVLPPNKMCLCDISEWCSKQFEIEQALSPATRRFPSSVL